MTKQPAQPYIVAQKGIDTYTGSDLKADRVNRQTGTHIVIIESDEHFHVGCREHGYSTSALVKYSRACDLARMPREWCPDCETAPAPQPKRRERATGGPQKDPQEAMAHARAAKDRVAQERAQAARVEAQAELLRLPGKLLEAEANLNAARDRSNAVFAQLDRARPGTDEYHELKDQWDKQERLVSALNGQLMGWTIRQRQLDRVAA